MTLAVDIDDGRARIPSMAFEHGGFRTWARSGDMPEGVVVSFIAGEVLVEMSPESTESHNKPKTKVTTTLDRLITDRDLGEAYSDRTLLTNVDAELSTEPDFLFASWEAFESGRLRLVEKADRKDYIELEGTPDLVVEIVSDTSRRKDQTLLRDRYHRAGIPEYWLIDVRDEISFQILRYSADGYHAGAPSDQPQWSEVFGESFALRRSKNRLGRWRYALDIV
jgi:Uma2 family endonuclease